MAFRHLGNKAAAEDAVQDALLGCLPTHRPIQRSSEAIDLGKRDGDSFRPYADAQKRARQFHVSLDGTHREERYDFSERLPALRPNPAIEYRKTELRQHAARRMRHLSPILPKTFQLRELDGRTIRETANILGLAEGTVEASWQAPAPKSEITRVKLESRFPHASTYGAQ